MFPHSSLALSGRASSLVLEARLRAWHVDGVKPEILLPGARAIPICHKFVLYGIPQYLISTVSEATPPTPKQRPTPTTTTDTAMATEKSPFFRLPRELRDAIYDFVALITCIGLHLRLALPLRARLESMFTLQASKSNAMIKHKTPSILSIFRATRHLSGRRRTECTRLVLVEAACTLLHGLQRVDWGENELWCDLFLHFEILYPRREGTTGNMLKGRSDRDHWWKTLGDRFMYYDDK